MDKLTAADLDKHIAEKYGTPTTRHFPRTLDEAFDTPDTPHYAASGEDAHGHVIHFGGAMRPITPTLETRTPWHRHIVEWLVITSCAVSVLALLLFLWGVL